MSETDNIELFHYTGTTGLKGILSTRTLWATDGNFLNDTSEGTIPDEILRRLSGMTSSYGLHLDLAYEWLKKKTDEIPKSRFFAACFCRQPDLLSQWRGYSTGLTGYALGFKQDILKKYIDFGSHQIGECLYIEDKHYIEIETKFAAQIEAVKVAFEKHQSPLEEGAFAEQLHWLNGPNEVQKKACEDLLDDFWDSMIGKIISLRPFLKPHAFREESETRIVVSAEEGKKLMYRDNANNLVPYLEIDITEVIKNGGLSCIVVGPSSHHGRAIQGVERFLEDEEISGVKIHSTAATFARY
jgi:hypothetical protein